MERLEFDLLFRWFVGLGIDDPVWDATSFTKNRERVLNEAIAQAFLSALLGDPKVKRLLSHGTFTIDRHAVEGVGRHEELPAQGWQRQAARWRAQR